jgi:hypothetical protein
MAKKLRASFHALTVMGEDYCNDQRFWPLTRAGKPLWEFKHHDHRLYCARIVRGRAVEIILLHGWSKDKEGKSKEEDHQVATAISLYEEYLAEPKQERTL